MQKLLPKLFAACFISLAAALAHAQSTPPHVVVSNPEGAQLKIVVASSPKGNSTISDKRTVALVAGRNLVRFFGVPATLDSDSVQPLIVPANGQKAAVEVLQQRFRPIVKATELGMLQRAIGQSVTVLREHGAPPLKGTLITTNEVILLDTPDGIVVNPQGTFIVPRPDDRPGERETFSTAPVLEWVIEAPAAGQYSFEARYSMTGLSWTASYRAAQEVTGNSSRLNLYGWLNLKNESSLDFRGAQIFLSDAGNLKVPQTVDLPRGEEKQISFLRVKDLPVVREWVFWPTRGGEFLKASGDQLLQMVYRIQNVPENQLGIALPAGVLTLWNVNAEGALQHTAQQAISYTPSGAMLWIGLGNDAFFTARRSVVASRQLNPVTQEHTIQIELSDRSPATSALVIENLPWRSKITEAKVDENPIKPVVADNVATLAINTETNPHPVLTYVVEVKN